jgi:type IV pilus assembly protein PilC
LDFVQAKAGLGVVPCLPFLTRRLSRMPTYAYTARAKNGTKQQGTLTADTRQAASQMLQQKGLIADKLVEKKGRLAAGPKLNKRVKTTELLVFTRQLSTIVSAGLPLMQGLDILADQTEDPNFGAIIDAIAQDVESGETFSDALRKYPKAFPDLYVSMVRSGEASGDLDGVLLQLADYLEASEELKRRIKSAMTYPVVAFGMIILIASGLIIFVVPQFATIFEQMGGTLPAPTRILIAISNFLRSWYAVPGIALFAFLVTFSLKTYGKTETGKYNLDKARLRIPVFGMLARKVAISRFTRTLSTLTRSGVNILQALEITERTAGNEVFARAVREAADSVRNGDTLADPLMRSEVFPSMVTRMIGVGEKTGALEIMLAKISDFYDAEVKALVDSLTSLIEPILIGLMGVVVGGIVIALFMPILMLSQLVS